MGWPMIGAVVLMFATCAPTLPTCAEGTSRREGRGPDGVLAVSCVNAAGTADGPYVELNEDRSVRRSGAFLRGTADGTWRTYDSQGMLSELSYRAGVRDGVSFTRSRHTRVIVEVGAYHVDVPVGWWHWFSDDGRLLGSSNFVDGSGDMLSFDKEGRKVRSLRLVRGTVIEETTYDHAGNIRSRRTIAENPVLP